MKKDAMKDQGYFCCYGWLCSFLESSMTFILIGEKLDGHHRPYTSNDSWKNSYYVTYFFFSLFSLLWSWKSDSSITYFNSYTLFKCLAHEVTFIMVENHWKSLIILQHCERSEQSLLSKLEETIEMVRWRLRILFSISPILTDFLATKPIKIPISLWKLIFAHTFSEMRHFWWFSNMMLI